MQCEHTVFESRQPRFALWRQIQSAVEPRLQRGQCGSVQRGVYSRRHFTL